MCLPMVPSLRHVSGEGASRSILQDEGQVELREERLFCIDDVDVPLPKIGLYLQHGPQAHPLKRIFQSNQNFGCAVNKGLHAHTSLKATGQNSPPIGGGQHKRRDRGKRGAPIERPTRKLM
jgi:hypothetical protein